MGQTLTWASLGDIPGGQTAVTVKLMVGASVSSTTGFKSFGTFHAQYGDVYGEGFTADLCREIQVVPAPVPQIDKALDPSTPSPVSPGGTVTWTLTYSNTGTATLSNAVVEDVLPPGFVFSSATPAPSQVIPASPSTIVRWNVGNLAGPSGPFTITVNALAPSVMVSPTTFTNNATLTGTFTSGGTTLTLSDDASANVDVETPALQINKSVSPTGAVQANAILTYSLSPFFEDPDISNGVQLLNNVQVSDPIPANTTLQFTAGTFPNAGGFCQDNSDPPVIVACSTGLAPPNEVAWNLGSNDPDVPAVSAPPGSYLCPASVTIQSVEYDGYVHRQERADDRAWDGPSLLTNPGKNNTTNSTKYTLIRFDLSAVPAGAIIQSATLGLNVTTNKSNHFDQIHRMNTAWTSNATWLSRDGTNPWASGASFGSADYQADTIAVIAPKTNGLKTALVTSAVQDWQIQNGVPNNGLVLLSTGTDNGDAKYDSSEAPTIANRPFLKVTYLDVTSTPPAGCTSASAQAYDARCRHVRVSRCDATKNFGTATTMLTNPDTSRRLRPSQVQPGALRPQQHPAQRQHHRGAARGLRHRQGQHWIPHGRRAPGAHPVG